MKAFITLSILLLLCLSVSGKPSAPSTPKVGDNSLTCTLCEFVVNLIENYVEQNATEEEILGWLDSDCEILGNSNWIAQCKALVNDYGKDLIALVINNETPEAACTQVTLCNSTNTTRISFTSFNKAHTNKVKDANVSCPICEFVVHKAEQYVQTNASEAEILKFVEDDCKLLMDPSWVSTCQGLVSEYGPEVITLLLSKAPAQDICTLLKFCNSSATYFIPFEDKVKGGSLCIICEYVAGLVENYLSNNQTESQILTALEKDCKLLEHPSWVAECKLLVATYLPELIAGLVKKESPEVVCTQLHLCNSSVIAEAVPTKVKIF